MKDKYIYSGLLIGLIGFILFFYHNNESLAFFAVSALLISLGNFKSIKQKDIIFLNVAVIFALLLVLSNGYYFTFSLMMIPLGYKIITEKPKTRMFLLNILKEHKD